MRPHRLEGLQLHRRPAMDAVDPESFFGYDRGTPELAEDDEVDKELLTPRRQRRKKSAESDEESSGERYPMQAIRRSPLANEASEEMDFSEVRRMVQAEAEKAEAKANITDDSLEEQLSALRKRAGIVPMKDSDIKAREIRASSGRVPGVGRRDMPAKQRTPRFNTSTSEESRQQQQQMVPRRRPEMRRRQDVSKKAADVEDAWLSQRHKVKPMSSEHDNMGVNELATALAPGAAPPKPPLPSAAKPPLPAGARGKRIPSVRDEPW